MAWRHMKSWISIRPPTAFTKTRAQVDYENWTLSQLNEDLGQGSPLHGVLQELAGSELGILFHRGVLISLRIFFC